MKGLLDTHTFIWWDSDPDQLSTDVRAFLLEPSNIVFLSVASVWEMVIKYALGKLQLHKPLDIIVAEQQANGIQILPILLEHVLAVADLPAIHNDPFDRLLVAQAKVEEVIVLSADPIVARYPVQVVW
jgi:PIN domain nuclease of toxin-antitoxin system